MLPSHMLCAALLCCTSTGLNPRSVVTGLAAPPLPPSLRVAPRAAVVCTAAKRGNEEAASMRAVRQAMERTIPGYSHLHRAIRTYRNKLILVRLDFQLEMVQCYLARRRSAYTSTPPDESEADVFRAELDAPPAYGHSILWFAKGEALLLEVKSAFLEKMQCYDEHAELDKLETQHHVYQQSAMRALQAQKRWMKVNDELGEHCGVDESIAWSAADIWNDLPAGTTEAAARRARLENDYLMSPADRLERNFLAPSSAAVPTAVRVPPTASDLAAFICLYPHLPIFYASHRQMDGTHAAHVWIGAHHFAWNDVTVSVRNAYYWQIKL